MHIDRTALASVAALLGLAGVALSSPEGWTTRRYGLRDLTVDRASSLRPSDYEAGMFRPYETNTVAMETLSEPTELGGVFEPGLGDIGSIVSGLVEEAEPESEVDVDRGRLIVRSSPAGQQRAEAALTVLRRAFGRRAVVDVEEIVLPPGAATEATPSAATLAAWRAADERGGTRSVTLSAALGAWRAATAVTATSAVVDVNVEISEGAAIADPVVEDVDEGLRVLARPLPLLDGRVLLRVVAAAGELRGPLRRMALGQDELGTVDLPDLEAAFVSTELALEAGRPRAVTCARPDGARRVFVFTLREAPWERIGGTLRLLPVGALAADAPVLVLDACDQPYVEGTPSLTLMEIEDVGSARLDGGIVADAVRERRAVAVENGTMEVEELAWPLGGALVVRGTDGDLDAAEDVVRGFEDELVRHADVRLRFVERPAEGGAGRVVGELGSQVPLDVPVALGAYRSVAYVGDFEVEVAQNSKIADPMIVSATAGLLANLRLSEAEEGTLAAVVEVRASAVDGPQAAAFGATDVGVLERVSSRVAYAQQDLLVRRGVAYEIDLGASPYGGPGARLVAELTVE